jgi:hypothetical protein
MYKKIQTRKAIPMIDNTYKEAFSQEWIERNINDGTQEYVILRQIIPWQKMVDRLVKFYSETQGAKGKSLRMMIAVLIASRFEQLSDRKIIKAIKENRYLQYFCNVPDNELSFFLDSSSLCIFRNRLQEKGMGIIEEEVFNRLRRSGIIRGDNLLMDSTVLESNIIYPNDVQLIYQAFKQMRSFAKLHGIAIWWNDDEIKRVWRGFGLDKNKQTTRKTWLIQLNELLIPALETLDEKVQSLNTSTKRKNKGVKLLNLLNKLEEQTVEKLLGEQHIENRIVSLNETDARPIKKGKSYPSCEFGTTLQMTFNREGFLITTENFIGKPNDKTLYPGTLKLYRERMKRYPETAVTDLGYRSQDNLKNISKKVKNVFMGRSSDVSDEKREFCHKARSATEGFIAVAKNLRGFGRSLYQGLQGDRIWTLLCQTAYNLKKFLQLYFSDKLEDQHLVKLGI